MPCRRGILGECYATLIATREEYGASPAKKVQTTYCRIIQLALAGTVVFAIEVLSGRDFRGLTICISIIYERMMKIFGELGFVSAWLLARA
jgi:hypothetical protein